MDSNTIFRVAMIAIFAAYQFPRTFFRNKARKSRTQSARTQSGGTGLDLQESKWRLILMGLAGLGTNLVALLWVINPNWLTWSNLNLPIWLRWAGIALGGITVVMGFHVHRILGRNFTPTLETPEGNYLVKEGVYAHIRHPMYTTFFLLFTATFLITTNWLIAFFGLIYSILIVNRVKSEEIMMVQTFGSQYREYKQQSGRFFPPVFTGP